ncbi:MAG: cell wall-binding repeat-containing protein [Actinomycetota bacterium]|nr:cell wall-binding repeat-containing protein [Actinomycetota bacterium]
MSARVRQFGFRELLFAIVVLPLLLGLSAGQDDSEIAINTYPLTFDSTGGLEPVNFMSSIVEAPFTMAGLTWRGTAPIEAWYRVDDGGGIWSEWRPLDVSAIDAPDPGTAEAERHTAGSELIYAGLNERIQFQISGIVPSNPEAVLIDTSIAADTSVEPFSEQSEPSISESAVPGQPTIRPRTDWDPTNRCPPREIPEEIQVTTAIIHHTGIDRLYSASEVPNILLGYCLYHRNSQGWDDIAYNILVDRFGTIWEGRAGGVDKGIRGGHAKGFSSYSTGIAMIGNFTGSAPGWQQRTALEQLLAWKLGVHNLDPRGTTNLISMGSYKYDEGVPVTLDTISGHRDVQATACPGIYAYNLLPRFRTNTAAIWTPPPTDYYAHPVVGDFDGDGAEEGVVYRQSDGTWWLYDGGSSTMALDGADGGAVDGAISADVDGDGSDEIVVQSGAIVRVMHGSGAGLTSTDAGSLGSSAGWTLDVGDVNGDGAEEVVFVDGSGSASVLIGGSVAAWGSIGSGHEFTMVGDFDGDGDSDLAGLRSNGAVAVALSTGSGFAPAAMWGDAGPDGGWKYAIAGDLDGDGDDDIAAFRSSVETWYGLMSTGSRFGNTRSIETPTLNHWSEAFAFDYQSDGRVEVIALDAYTGTWHIGRFDGLEPVFTRIEDSPYRETVVRNDSGSGTAFLSWFGQEFAWVNTELGFGVGGEADATNRIFGASRYDTAARISYSAFLSADVVFVGTGEKYPDALTGGSAAVLLDAPMLLTAPTSLPASTLAEIRRLGPSKIVLLGGTAAVSSAVEAQLASLAPNGVVRIGGADRYETAALISQAYFAPATPIVYVATGLNFPDALAGVPGAARAGAPILLVQTNSLPAATAAEIDRLAPAEIVILGGPVAVSDAVARELSLHAPVVRRLAGSDRYGTAAAISAEAYLNGSDVAFVAIGTNFPDAVAAGPAAAHLGGSLLLTQNLSMTSYTLNELRRLRPTRITVIGNETVVSDDALDEPEGIGIGGLSERVSNLPRP